MCLLRTRAVEEPGTWRQADQGKLIKAARRYQQVGIREKLTKEFVWAERRMFWECLPVRSSTLEMTMNKLTRKSLDSKPADLARQKSLE